MLITLCGSARFETAFHEWNERLTLAGHVVLGLAVYPSSKNNTKDWYDPDTKMRLDLVHLAKIEESDAIVVINLDGYIGESTSREVAWAKIRNKRVYYVEGSGESDARDLLAHLIFGGLQNWI